MGPVVMAGAVGGASIAIWLQLVAVCSDPSELMTAALQASLPHAFCLLLHGGHECIVTGGGRMCTCTFRSGRHHGGSEPRWRWRAGRPRLLDEASNYVSSW